MFLCFMAGSEGDKSCEFKGKLVEVSVWVEKFTTQLPKGGIILL